MTMCYLFVRREGTWVAERALVGTDTAAMDSFGFWVALSGPRALVGAWRDDDAGSESGSAYAFCLEGGSAR